MVAKIIIVGIIISIIIISSSVLILQEQLKSENRFQVYREEFKDVEWNNEVTRILPREELGKEWTLLWSDGSEEFVEGQYPIMVKKTIAENEIVSTSYNYAHIENGTYQILIWKSELISDWNPRETVEGIFMQMDAKIEKIFVGLDLIPNCVVAYYDFYGDEKEITNELLFSECAKNDFRIRVHLVEGEYNQETIGNIVYLSNSVVGKI